MRKPKSPTVTKVADDKVKEAGAPERLPEARRPRPRMIVSFLMMSKADVQAIAATHSLLPNSLIIIKHLLSGRGEMEGWL